MSRLPPSPHQLLQQPTNDGLMHTTAKPAEASASPSLTPLSRAPPTLTPSSSSRARASDGSDTTVTVPERVKVVVRVRPPLNSDESAGAVSISPPTGKLTLFRPDAPIPQADFVFDKVLECSASQQDVFNAGVKDVVDDVLKGYNGTVMAYGMTGAGKTFTLSNTEPSAIGMIPRAVAEIFKKALEDPFHTYVVTMSYIQIYMELIQDLLRPDSDNLQIREDANNGVYLANVHEVKVSTLEECLHYLELGERNRVFAFTHLNAHSSRSHVVVMVTVIKSRKYMTNAEKAEARKAEKGDKDCVVAQKVKVGKLYMVDLAGSERLKKSKSIGLRASEAISINKSLTTLGMCISARANESPHVPFRDSKLTRLLQESLGGNAKTTLIVCLADACVHADETLQSLQFGSRAMCIKNKPVVNERIDYRVLHAELMSQLDTVHDRAHELEAVLVRTEEERDTMLAELEREKAHFAAILAALKAEAAGEVQAKEAQLAAKDSELAEKDSQLGEVVQKVEATAQRVVQLEAEKADLAAAHYLQVAELSGKVQELLAAQASMTASHRQEAAALATAHRQEVASLKDQLRASEQALQQAKGEGAEARAEGAKAHAEGDKARAEAAALQAENASLQAENASLQAELAQAWAAMRAMLAASAAVEQGMQEATHAAQQAMAGLEREREEEGPGVGGEEGRSAAGDTTAAARGAAGAGAGEACVSGAQQGAGAAPAVEQLGPAAAGAAASVSGSSTHSGAGQGSHGARGGSSGGAVLPASSLVDLVTATISGDGPTVTDPDLVDDAQGPSEGAAGRASAPEQGNGAPGGLAGTSVAAADAEPSTASSLQPGNPASAAAPSASTLKAAQPGAGEGSPAQPHNVGRAGSNDSPLPSARGPYHYPPTHAQASGLDTGDGASSPSSDASAPRAYPRRLSNHLNPAFDLPPSLASSVDHPSGTLVPAGPQGAASAAGGQAQVAAQGQQGQETTEELVAELHASAQRLASAAHGVDAVLAQSRGVMGRQAGEAREGAAGAARLEARVAELSAELAQARALAGSQAEQLGTTRAELVATSATLEATAAELRGCEGRLAETEGAAEELQGELDETRGQLDEALGQLEDAHVRLAALGEELREVESARAVGERVIAQRSAAGLERLDVGRRVHAAMAIQRAYKRWRARVLAGRLEREQEAVQALEQQRQQAAREAQRAAQLQGAAQGQALVLASMGVLREAVESVMLGFIGRKKELELRSQLAERIQSAAPVLQKKPGGAGGQAGQGASGRLARGASMGPLASGGTSKGLGAASGSFRLLATAAPVSVPAATSASARD